MPAEPTFPAGGASTAEERAVVAEAGSAGFRTVWSTIRPANAASCRVIERLGFRVQFETDDDGPMRYYVRRLGEPDGVPTGPR